MADAVAEERPEDNNISNDEDAADSETQELEEEESGGDAPVNKKGRGRPPKNPGAPKMVKVPSGRGKGRPRKSDRGDSSTPPKKRKKIDKERTIAPGILRDTPRLSYKDDSSSESGGETKSSDSEADYKLAKKLSSLSTPKKESGALRDKPRLSYKDESDSDIESGFESDIVPQAKQPSKGRGRPKLEPGMKGKYTPKKSQSAEGGKSQKGRGRPKGAKNKPKTPSSNDASEKTDENGEPPVKKGRGRPKGSGNKDKVVKVPSGRPRGRPVGSFKKKKGQAQGTPKVPGRGKGRPKGSGRQFFTYENEDEQKKEGDMQSEDDSEQDKEESVSEDNEMNSSADEMSVDQSAGEEEGTEDKNQSNEEEGSQSNEEEGNQSNEEEDGSQSN